MPPSDRPFGNDTLSIPCYLAAGDDDPGLGSWKREHPQWFVAGTWTRPARRRGQPSPEMRDRALAWMKETRDLERAQSRPGGPLDPNWIDAALRSATFPIGAPGLDEAHREVGPEAGPTESGPGFALYPPSVQDQAPLIHRVSDADDAVSAADNDRVVSAADKAIQQRIRETGDRIRSISNAVLQERAQFIDRSGTAANFGSRH